MNRLFPWLALVCLLGIGCNRPAPAEPETVDQAASRVFAVAEKLEKSQKTKQAISAYQQVMSHFPQTPEGKLAAERISQAQREALRKASVRKAH